YDVTFRRVPEYQYGAYLGWGMRFYAHDSFPVLQMIYPDREGRWPWQDGVSPGIRALQPVLADEPEPPWARDPAVERAREFCIQPFATPVGISIESFDNCA